MQIFRDLNAGKAISDPVLNQPSQAEQKEGVLPASLFKSLHTRKPLRRLHTAPTTVMSATPIAKGVPLEMNEANQQTIPFHLHDIQNAKLKLRESTSSTSSKWMKPKRSPERSMHSVLEKQFGVMRLVSPSRLTY
jgi:hypothetical protein